VYDRAAMLLIPGPTPVLDRIRDAMSRPMIPHRAPEFAQLYTELTTRLLPIFGLDTQGAALVLPGSGTGLMEAVMLSLLVPDSDVVVCVNGRFSKRWAMLCRNADWLGCNICDVTAPWGSPVDPDQLRQSLTELPNVRAVIVVHSETSTGTVSDLQQIASVVRTAAPQAMLLADAITSAGAMPVQMKDWGVDASVLSSQKSPGLPPGAGVVALGPRALHVLQSTESQVPVSMDLRWHLGAHVKGTVACTPPISHVFGFLEWLNMIDEEGLAARFARIARQAQMLRAALQDLGFPLFSLAPSPSVTAATVPAHNASALRKTLKETHNISIAGGQDQLKEQIIRVGHMGSVSDQNLEQFIDAMRHVLAQTHPQEKHA
jgi:aspartate aminotransferase-like enzyme